MLRRYPWLPVAFGNATLLFASGIPTPLYPLYERHWNFGTGLLSVVFAGYVVGITAVLLLIGRASDDIGRRPLLLAGLLVGLVGTVVFLAASGPAWLFVGRLLNGAGIGLFSGAGVAALVELHPRHDRGFAAMAAQMSISAGSATGPLLAGALAQWAPLPLRLPWALHLGVAVLAIALVLRLPNDARRPFRRVLRLQGIRVPRAMRFLFFATALGTFCISATAGLFIAIAPTLLRDSLHLGGPIVAGALITVLQSVAFVATIAAGRFEAHRAGAIGMVAASAGVGTAALAAQLGQWPLFLLATVLTGIGLAFGYTGTLSAVNAAAPEDRRAEVVSGYYLAAYLGLAVPIVGLGFAADAFGLLRALSIFAAVTAAVGIGAAAGTLRARTRVAAA
jgi:MFS family permease